MGSFAKLAFAAAGIWSAFLYYGSLQEDVFRYEAPDGSRFVYSWLLQSIEAAANVFVGLLGLMATGFTLNVPHGFLAVCGCSEVSAKYCKSMALQTGLSFPTAVLAKSGKIVPVMAGSFIIGGRRFSVREYIQSAAIIGGTVGMSLARLYGGRHDKQQYDTAIGALFIIASLSVDGLTSGLQEKMLSASKSRGARLKPYDLMFWTNSYQMLLALTVASLSGELYPGLQFLIEYPQIRSQVLKFGICSALGQSFIFYTLAEFDPVTLVFLTTTRKVCSVLLSILFKGHQLNSAAWAGLAVVVAGVAGELQGRCARHASKPEKPEGSWTAEYRDVKGRFCVEPGVVT